MTVQATTLQLYSFIKTDFGTGAGVWIPWNFKNTYIAEHIETAALYWVKVNHGNNFLIYLMCSYLIVRIPGRWHVSRFAFISLDFNLSYNKMLPGKASTFAILHY